MTPSQHTGNRPETAVDAPARLLAPVGKGDDLTAVLGLPLGNIELWDESWRERQDSRASHFGEDLAAFKRDIRIHGLPKPTDDATAVIPKTPAQPRADWDRPDPPLPSCKRKTMSMALLVGADLVIGFLGAVVLFALAVS